MLLCALSHYFTLRLEYLNSALCLHSNLPFVLQAAAILSGQDVTKKKRARSPARHDGSMLQSSLQRGPQTPGLTTELDLLPPERPAQLNGQLPQPAQIPGMTNQPAQIPAITPQDDPLQAMYQSPLHSCDHCPSQLTPMSFAQSSLSRAEPALSQAEEAHLLHLETQPMSHQSTVSSRQVSTQLPRKLPMQMPESRDPRSVLPAKVCISQPSPASSRQAPAQLPAKLPVPSPAASRDPRRLPYCASIVAATLSELEKGSSPMALSYSPQHAQDSEPRPPVSPTQSALFAALLMPDSPDAISSAVNAEDALTQASSPAGRSSPQSNAMSHLPQEPRLSDSLNPFMDALLSDDCGEADFARGDAGSDFNLGQEDSHYAMLSEAIQIAGQHAQHSQHDTITSPQMSPVTAACQDTLQAQSLLPRAPSSTLSSQTFSPPQAVTVSRLQKQFPTFKSSRSVPAASGSTGKPFMIKRRWPESPPYTICQWQLLVMQ